MAQIIRDGAPAPWQADKTPHLVAFAVDTGYGPKSTAERGGSRSRTALRLVRPPLQRRTHRTPGCAHLDRRRHSAARSTCAAAPNVRSSPLGDNTVCKSRNNFADALFTQGLMALMQPIICCMRAQSAREFMTEFSGGATPHRSGVAQS
eukprot:scaffold77735_cov39-Phaeocystis_antarctica.AAC.3